MGADDDIDAAVCKSLLDLIELLRRHQSRCLCNVDREATETLGEILEMLTGQQRGRNHHRHLLAIERHRECRAQRYFGLAETDVAADQAIHWTTSIEIMQRGVDRAQLVLGLFVWKPCAEFVVSALMQWKLRRDVDLALRGDLDQLAGDLANAVLELGFARLPATTAETVEFDVGLVGAVARQQLDILDRKKQLGLVRIVQFETVMRRAADIERLQADEASDAVLDVDDDIAGREARDFRDEILKLPARLARTNESDRRECPAR